MKILAKKVYTSKLSVSSKMLGALVRGVQLVKGSDHLTTYYLRPWVHSLKFDSALILDSPCTNKILLFEKQNNQSEKTQARLHPLNC